MENTEFDYYANEICDECGGVDFHKTFCSFHWDWDSNNY